MPRVLHPMLVLLAALIGGAAPGYAQNPPALLPVTAWQGRTMGSDYTVKIVDGKLSEAQVTALKTEIEATLIEVNRQMSDYVPDSELSRFNRAPVNVPFKVSPDFTRVTRWALELSRLSNGAFDPTLGPLINLWGFGEKTSEHAVPAAAALAAAKARTGWRHLTIAEDETLTKDLPELALDPGAVAKGFGVDQMVKVLRGHGLENVYASIAGEVRVTGHNPRGTKWVLGLEAGLKFIDARENTAALFILRENDGTFRQVASSRFAKLTGTTP